MVQQCLIFFSFLLFSGEVLAQDERYYRQILAGELPGLNDNLVEVPIPQFNVKGPSYKIDLDGDQIEETIQPQKRDGVDWLEIRNFAENKIFEAKLLAMGTDSHLYKIKLVNINKKVKALVLFLDEGSTSGKRFESTARIFVLSFENNDLKTLSLTEGPHFYHEKEAQREQYWRRTYSVNIFDIDKDGTREIAVQYNHIQRILKYSGKGVWKRY